MEHLKMSWSTSLCSMEWRRYTSLVTVRIFSRGYWCRRRVMCVYEEQACWMFIIHVRARVGSWKLAHWVLLSGLLNHFPNLSGTLHSLQHPCMSSVGKCNGACVISIMATQNWKYWVALDTERWKEFRLDDYGNSIKIRSLFTL